jgi:hypothetical protein
MSAVNVESTNAQTIDVKSRGTNIVSIIRPSITTFGAQLDRVLHWAVLREDRSSEILTQVVPPVGYTTSILGLNEDSHKYTIELLTTAQRFAMMVLMRVKHGFACPRPHEYSPLVQPMIEAPPFSAFPSGHATETYMFATVVRLLTQSSRWTSLLDLQLQKLAARVATNRVIAGLHFPVDTMAGRMLGETLGEFFVHLCVDRCDAIAGHVAGPGWTERTFDGIRVNALSDFDPFERMDDIADSAPSGGPQPAGPYAANVGRPRHQPKQPASCSVLQWLWERARTEMQPYGA